MLPLTVKGMEATFAVVNDSRLTVKREGHKRLQ